MNLKYVRVSLYTFIVCGFISKITRMQKSLQKSPMCKELETLLSYKGKIPTSTNVNLMVRAGLITCETDGTRYHLEDINALRRYNEMARGMI